MTFLALMTEYLRQYETRKRELEKLRLACEYAERDLRRFEARHPEVIAAAT